MTSPLRAALCLLVLAALGCAPDEAPPPAHRVVLVVGDEGATSRELERGARRAAGPLDAEVTWRGTFGEDGDDHQALLVRQATTEGFDGMIVVPDDDADLGDALDAARRRGVPYVVVGTSGAADGAVARVLHDPHEAGRRAAEEVVARLGGSGRVALLRPAPDDALASARAAGALEVFAERAGVSVEVEIAVGSSETEALRATAEQVHRLRRVDALIAFRGAATHGALLALRDADLYGRHVLVGFDATTHLLDALAARGLTALVVDDPARLADQALRALVSHLRGHPVPAEQPVPSLVVTTENRVDLEVGLLER